MENRTARRLRRGFTLIELMIGVVIALFLTAAALTFVRHETRLLGISQDRVDMIQNARAALDLLGEDLRSAGQGIGYDETGTFRGLMLGTFTAGGLTWNTAGNGRAITLYDTANGAPRGTPWSSVVVDIGILFASGSYRTVNNWTPAGTLQFCGRDDNGDGNADSGFDDPEDLIAVIRSEDGTSAETIVLSGIGGPGPCVHGECLWGCYTANWAPAPVQLFNTGTAHGPNYIGAELGARLQQVVYFVGADATSGMGYLQRVTFRGNPTENCAAPDRTCGGTVAEGVESLQMQVYQYVTAPPGWVNVGTGPITSTDRIRIDVEMVVRADGTDERPHTAVPLRLRPNSCVPEPCGSQDYTERRAYRTSIEVKNAGFMRIR